MAHHARAVAQPDDERAGSLTACDIGVGLALILEDVFQDAGKALRALAEHALGGPDQILTLVGIRRCHGGAGSRGGGSGGRRRLLARIARLRRDCAVRLGSGRGLLRARRRIEVAVDRLIGIDGAHLRGRGRGHRYRNAPQHQPKPTHATPPENSVPFSIRACRLRCNEWRDDPSPTRARKAMRPQLIPARMLAIAAPSRPVPGDVGEWLKPAVC